MVDDDIDLDTVGSAPVIAAGGDERGADDRLKFEADRRLEEAPSTTELRAPTTAWPRAARRTYSRGEEVFDPAQLS